MDLACGAPSITLHKPLAANAGMRVRGPKSTIRQYGICWWCRHRIHYPLDSEPTILILDSGEVVD